MAESLGLTQERLFARNQNFQNSSTTSTSESFAVSLRKKKRTDYICEKRKREIESLSCNTPKPLPANRETLSQIKEYLLQGPDSIYFTTSLNYLIKSFKQEDRSLLLKISKDLDLVSILSSYCNSLIQSSDEFRLVLNCVCLLTSCPSFITSDLFLNKIDDLCINLISHYDSYISETAVWCLSNLCVDNLKCREKLIKSGSVKVLIEKFDSPKTQSLLFWSLRNILEGSSQLDFSLQSRLLDLISINLKLKSKETYIECLYVFSHLSNDSNCIVQIIKSKCFRQLFRALDSSYASVVAEALRTVGNISAGTSNCAQALLDKEILDKLYKILENFKNEMKLKRSVFWVLSNLTAGTKSQIDLIVSHPILVKIMTSLNDSFLIIRKEAARCVNNIAKLGKNDSVWALVNVGILKEAKELLENSLDDEMSLNMLESVFIVFKSFKSAHKHEVVKIMKACGCFDIIEKLMLRENKYIVKAAEKILKKVEDVNEEVAGEVFN